MNILFTNAGRRTYLLKYALELVSTPDFPNLRVFASDASPATAALCVSELVTPLITPYVSAGEEQYCQALLDECRRHRISAIIPLMDFEIPLLARNASRFREHGITLWVSSPEVVDSCLDKRKFHEFCIKSGLSTPRSWFDEVPEGIDAPLVRKKILGSGSVGLAFFEPGEQLPAHDPDFMYQERIVGVEFGMDVLNDLSGSFVHACARRKLLMRAGETDKAESILGSEITEIGKQVSGALGHVGNLDLDYLKTESGDVYFIDFNPRFGGGYPFTHASGFDYVRAILLMTSGATLSPSDWPAGREIVGMKGLELFCRPRLA